MPLTVLPSRPSPDPATVIRLFHQTELEWHRHAATESIIDEGAALIAERSHGESCLLGVGGLGGAAPGEFIAAAALSFAQCGGTLDALQLSPACPLADAATIEQWLTDAHWQPRRFEILRLGRPQSIGGPNPRPQVQVIPARASFRHVQALDAEHPEQLQPHLDDPHTDAWIALERSANNATLAIGAVAILTVGETGRIAHLHVTQHHRGRGVGRLLMDRAIGVASRALLKHVFIAIEDGNQAGRRLASDAGFVRIGAFTHWVKPGKITGA